MALARTYASKVRLKFTKYVVILFLSSLSTSDPGYYCDGNILFMICSGITVTVDVFVVLRPSSSRCCLTLASTGDVGVLIPCSS